MSVYVDEMAVCLRNRNWPYDQACHLVADSVEELHKFARRLGLKRSWFQNKSLPHYDLTTGMRFKAIRLGAVEIDRNKFVEIMREYQPKRAGHQSIFLRKESTMKTILITALLFVILVVSSGCQDAIRFAPSEQQKQLAWLTNDLAKGIESTGTDAGSPAIKKLAQGTTATALYYGLPKEPADPKDFEAIATTATEQSMERPDPWEVADNMLLLAGGIATVLGGVGGTKIASGIVKLRAKAKALQEVVVGNELLKTNGGDFGKAHMGQSVKTRTIVAGIRAQSAVPKIPPVISPKSSTPEATDSSKSAA